MKIGGCGVVKLPEANSGVSHNMKTKIRIMSNGERSDVPSCGLWRDGLSRDDRNARCWGCTVQDAGCMYSMYAPYDLGPYNTKDSSVSECEWRDSGPWIKAAHKKVAIFVAGCD